MKENENKLYNDENEIRWCFREWLHATLDQTRDEPE